MDTDIYIYIYIHIYIHCRFERTLATDHLDVRPRGIDLSATAAVGARAEAYVLSREWEHHLALGGDAHSVGSSLCAAKSPAAATVGLVADILQH